MAIDLDKLAGKQGGDESRRLAKHWIEQIDRLRDSAEYKRWIKRGDTIEKRYRDERNRTDEEGQRRYNALWSNVEILRPALYGRTPVPVVERRFHDKDPVGRGAAQILERALRNEIEINGYHEALLQAVNDYLLPGRGVVWIRYEPEIQESVSLPPDSETDMRDSQGRIDANETDEKTGVDQSDRRPADKRMRLNEGGEKDLEEQKLAYTGDRIIRESVPVDYVAWQDFFTLPIKARTWVEVTAVAKRVHMSRDQLRRRFGNEIANAIPLSRDDRGQRVQYSMPDLHMIEDDKAQIYEVWNRVDQTVYWVAHGYEFLCDRKEDPLRLESFFPCPKPIYSNSTNSTLMPVPDYIQYQDQAIQLDELTQRIAMLTRACKMAGVYNAAAHDIRRLFDESVENELIPVDDWAAFGKEGGGIEGNWSLMPVDEIIKVINELIIARQKVKEDMDQLTGINDIMRGTSDARETLGGVRLKTNNTGTRLTARQNEIARFARDVVRLMANVMAENFSPQSLIEASGALYEEGLGPKEMPDLTALQNQQGQPGPAPGPMMPPAPPQGAAPPMAQGQPGPVPPPPGLNPAQPAPGGNVVPFRPQGAPQQPPQMGAPAGPPSPMQGQPPLSGTVLPPLPPELQEQFAAIKRIADAIGLIRDEKLRGFRVDIEVDSTIFPDMEQEKQERTQFIQAVSQFLGTGLQMGAAVPEAIPLLGKLLQFGVRGYRVGRDLEAAIEDFTDKALLKAQEARANPQPSPEQMKAQADMAKIQGQMQIAQQKHQMGMAKAQSDARMSQQKMQADERKAQAEVQREQLQIQGEQAQAAAEVQAQQMEIQIKQIEQQIEAMRLQLEQVKMQQETELTHAKMQHEQLSMQHEDQRMQHQSQMDQQKMAHQTRQAELQAMRPPPQPKPTGTV